MNVNLSSRRKSEWKTAEKEFLKENYGITIELETPETSPEQTTEEITNVARQFANYVECCFLLMKDKRNAVIIDCKNELSYAIIRKLRDKNITVLNAIFAREEYSYPPDCNVVRYRFVGFRSYC